MKDFFREKEFIESFKKVALPIAIQQLLFSSLSFVDSLMVGRLGQYEYNAVGLANEYLLIVIMVMVGIGAAVSIYITQYFGNSDYKGFRKSTGLGIIISFIFSVVALYISLFFPRLIMSIFTREKEILDFGVDYLNIIAFQIPLIAISIPLSMAFKSSKNAKVTLINSAISFGLNTLLNYILIFGNFGMPRLGIEGAAIATVVSRILGVLIYIIIIIINKDTPLHGSIKDYFAVNLSFVKKVFKTGWTVIIHETLWVLGVTAFTAILSMNRTDAYTAYQISLQFAMLIMILSGSIASTASVTIGAQLGRKDIEKALEYERKYSITQVLVSAFESIIVIIVSYFLIDLFNVSEAIKSVAFYVCIVESIIIPFKAYSGMQAAGILRSGGDTKYPVFIELMGVYLFDVPILYVLLTYTNLSTPVIIFFSSLGAVVTSVLLYKRVKSKKWAKNLIAT